jgi:hypothetical protein
MHLPYQSPAVDRANRANHAMQQCCDPAFFGGLNWNSVKDGIGSALRYLAPHAKTAAKDFAVSAISDL